MQTKNSKKGFTLVELVIVIAVIAILAAVLIPTFTNLIAKSNESAALQTISAQQSNYVSEVEGNVIANNTVFQSGDYVAVFYNGKLVSTVAKVSESKATITTSENGTDYQWTITFTSATEGTVVLKEKAINEANFPETGTTTNFELKDYSSNEDIARSGIKIFEPVSA